MWQWQRSWDLLERELSHEGGVLMNEISVSIKRPQKVPSSLLHVRNSKQMAICEPGSKTSEDTGLAGTLMLDFLWATQPMASLLQRPRWLRHLRSPLPKEGETLWKSWRIQDKEKHNQTALCVRERGEGGVGWGQGVGRCWASGQGTGRCELWKWFTNS